MKYRPLGRTGYNVSEISFGAWAIGGSWGTVDDEQSLRALHAAVDRGVNFFDTADVYGDGRSERLLGRLKRERKEPIVIATKVGRRLVPHTPEGYHYDNLAAFVDRSLRNLGVETIDLLQLHCPPSQVYRQPEVFAALDDLARAGKLRFYGVSVETVAEAMEAVFHPGVQSVQIIFNCFRHKPADEFFALARKRRVGIVVRVPLASGLLTGRITAQTRFDPDDHRSFNRHGEAFDQGETFSGVDLATGLSAVQELRRIVPRGMPLAQFALKWILMFDEVSCAIPGAKTPQQVAENCAASDLPPLTPQHMAAVRDIYDRLLRGAVHARW
ncbi:MAG: aldo/keto reductase [Phycisphaerae bacterium]|nr:aldo/keto reductase [Phycisphaerae bacterium]MDW8261604.1 aldo/keto reductase [Phycisphaerales bacterium]